MKKEYLLKLIEKAYVGGNEYDEYLDFFIDQLRNEHSFELANSIKEIKNNNIKVKKTDAIKTKKRKLEKTFFPENIINELNNIKIGYKKRLINNILLKGKPGTGKTTFVEMMSKELNLDIVNVKLSDIMDYKYGESIKKIEFLMKTYLDIPCIIFFDEAESLFSSRFTRNDLIETSRILTTMLKILDKDSKCIVCFATNLFKNIDNALIRRMDLIIDFNCYTDKEYIKILDYVNTQYDLQLKNSDKDFIISKINNSNWFTPSYLNSLCKKIAINNINKNYDIKSIVENYFMGVNCE